ncbi:MAG: hypothetical protein Kow00120_04220 [Anaerolineae bacterium]
MAYIRSGAFYQQGRPRPRLGMQRGLVFGLIMVAALAAFELFNYGTTEYALYTLIGDTQVLGMRWASVLALAFCCIDFAGLARIFTPEQGRDEPKEVWYLLGAWFVGASVNAIMTWWAVTNALVTRSLGNEVLSRAQLLTWVPIFIALLVWLTRILIIGTFGIAGDRLFTLGSQTMSLRGMFNPSRPRQPMQRTTPLQARAPQPRFQPQPQPQTQRPEPTYEPVEDEAPQPNPFGTTRPPFRQQGPAYTRAASRVATPPGGSYGFASRRDGSPAWRASSTYYYARPAYLEPPRRTTDDSRTMET